MRLKYFSHQLEHLLREDLPGWQGQKLMSSVSPSFLKKFEQNQSKATKCAVLVLIYQDGDELKFPLTLRHDYDGAHSAQVSLPGGKLEENDLDLSMTAKRETFEELGIGMDEIKIIGQLSNHYIPTSDFLITPFVGVLNHSPTFKPDKREVKKLMTIPIDNLNVDSLRKRKNITVQKQKIINVPYYDFDNETVWGATAMILSELSVLVKKYKTRETRSYTPIDHK